MHVTTIVWTTAQCRPDSTVRSRTTDNHVLGKSAAEWNQRLDAGGRAAQAWPLFVLLDSRQAKRAQAILNASLLVKRLDEPSPEVLRARLLVSTLQITVRSVGDTMLEEVAEEPRRHT